MRRLHTDFETFSELDIKAVGAHTYAMHESTEVLMLGWAIDDGPKHLWFPSEEPMPLDLESALFDQNCMCFAFNAAFERLIFEHVMGWIIPLSRWRCTMVEAYYLGFSGGLDAVLKQVGLEHKDARGHRLINLFCKPAPSNHKADRYTKENRPEEWEEFCEYCLQDVHTERQLHLWLMRYPAMPQWDWDRYQLDQRINDRGVPIDLDMAYGAVEMWDAEKERLTEHLKKVTGLPKVTRGPFHDWLNAQGLDVDNLRKETLVALTKVRCSPVVAEAIYTWAQKESKAVSKYTAVIKGQHGGRARGMFQFKGASRTDRTAGRRIQLQNLKRSFCPQPWIKPLSDAIAYKFAANATLISGMNVADTLGGAVRHVIRAQKGSTLIVCDLTSIESVILGWLTYCHTINDTFRSGRDSYRVFASRYYNIPYEAVTKAQRTFSKPPVLGAGYMLGWRGLIAYAENYGVEMDEDSARAAVNTFRNMYPEIPSFWHWIERSVKHVIRTGEPVDGYRMHIERDLDFLRIWLPSGRALSYFKPEVRQVQAPWDRTKLIDNVCYMGTNDKNQWTRIFAHAGLFTENIVQSIAMDILFHGMTLADQEDLAIVLQVHDEIGCEVPTWRAEQDLKTLQRCMTTQPSWAEDMWLGADGYISDHYMKD